MIFIEDYENIKDIIKKKMPIIPLARDKHCYNLGVFSSDPFCVGKHI